jgi:pimeloyl-ACP methyl ester carboxylesterase
VREQREFDVTGLTLAAQIWGAPGERPLLALHGWLDNAASFDLLAPLLSGCEVVALDLAGHGQSSSRSPDAAYNIWQDVGELFDVLDQLAWPRCSVLGHSRGGAVALLLAAAFPERVDKLVLLEGGVPLLGEPVDAPANLAQSILDSRSLRGKSGRVFADRQKAIAERAQGFTKISHAAAEILARRSLRAVPGGGFQWHADQRLKGASELRLTAEHVRAFVRGVRAPVLLLLADDGPFGRLPIYDEIIGLFANVEVVRLPGGHHLHLEGGEAEIADRILKFLAR